ncbi:hypothetical protein [Nocardioides daejeonensis]|uniref:hypothetical protein n=1 Tax=Nocardioides daejeonensis TaxID=1046556 RepID=UPI000D741583|nr:hypothetical protein [Nocardioides daejeonensis]
MRVGSWLVVVAAALLLVSGCQDDSTEADKPPTEAPTATSTVSIAPEESSATRSPDAQGEVQPCDLLTPQDATTAYARPMVWGGVGGGGSDENGVQWKYRTCSWQEEIDDGLEVTLQVSAAEDFADGVLTCPRLDHLGEPATEVPGLGVPASWLRTSTIDIEAILQLCTDTHVFGIEVEAEGATEADLDSLKEQSLALAGVLLQAAGA